MPIGNENDNVNLNNRLCERFVAAAWFFYIFPALFIVLLAVYTVRSDFYDVPYGGFAIGIILWMFFMRVRWVNKVENGVIEFAYIYKSQVDIKDVALCVGLGRTHAGTMNSPVMMYFVATRKWYLLQFYIVQCLEVYCFEKMMEAERVS